MDTPREFAEYLVSHQPLCSAEQEERFTDMHIKEIRERAVLMRNLCFPSAVAKGRIKKTIEWAFEFSEIPKFYRSVDSIVDDVYDETISGAQ